MIAGSKRCGLDVKNALGDCDCGQVVAFGECPASNGFDAAEDGDVDQVGAERKCADSDDPAANLKNS